MLQTTRDISARYQRPVRASCMDISASWGAVLLVSAILLVLG